MKAKIILVNFMLSFIGLSIDTENSPFWAGLVAIAWFLISGAILIRADRRGAMDNLKRKFKINDL
ncbi:MAG TPA: hypothetical protein DEG28_00940 [Porphyromonadaceae bacterium]|nr:hypothetical protein [Porphyromonadaceae bacterium]